MTFFSVIVATKGLAARPTLYDTLRSLANQTFKDFELITDDSGPTEYHARNRAARRAKGEVLAFTDDDTLPPPDWLEKASHYFRNNPDLVMLTGPVEGDVFGWGKKLHISEPFWAIGCNIFIRRKEFLELGGFEEDWGLNPPPDRGWRGDTGLCYSVLDRYGYSSYLHAEDVVNVHPGPMQSVWHPGVEAEFYRRHRSKVLRYIAPYDPRLCQFVVLNKVETDPRVLRYLAHDQKPRLDVIRQKAHKLDYKYRGRLRILDVGCEDGFLFAGCGYDYTGVDIDAYEVEGNFVQLDVDKPWPFRDMDFHLVVLGEVLEHVENPVHVLREAIRVSSDTVIATVPDEYSWPESKAPLLTREERMKRDGFKDVDEMARHFASKSPFLKELVSEKVKPHLWHRRWFTLETLKKTIEESTDKKYEVFKAGTPDGFSWFVVEIRS